jgi:hypothetical protein
MKMMLLRKRMPSIVGGIFAGALVSFALPSFMALWLTAESWLLQRYPAWLIFPQHLFLLLAIIVISLALFAFRPAVSGCIRLAHSWRVGLSIGIFTLWFVSSVIGLEIFASSYSRYSLIPWVPALLLTMLYFWNAERLTKSLSGAPVGSGATNPDLPVMTWDEDKLFRRNIVDNLVQQITADRVPIIALVGPWGDGKTSVLNLLQISLKAYQGVRVVRFSSWIPGTEAALVATLFNSIIRTVETEFFLGKAKTELIRYGRSLATVLPKAGTALREWFHEPSQAEQISELKRIIRELPIRLVIFIDDIDRMQVDELQALLKLIRGVSDFSNLTYVCAFHETALIRTLGATMNEEDAFTYLEKFFPVKYPLPPIDQAILAAEFDKRFEQLCKHSHVLETPLEQERFEKEFSPLWQTHIKLHLANFRRIQLFFNRISASLKPVAREVNVLDFFLLELIRDSMPSLFFEIYQSGRYFYYPTWRVNTWGESLSLDEDEATAKRKLFFDAFFGSIPENKKEFISTIMKKLFPVVRGYLEEKRGFGRAEPNQDVSEKEKKIYHPDFFPRYFVSRVPASQYSDAELEQFTGALQRWKTIEECQREFEEAFNLYHQQGLKRWHFLDRISTVVPELPEIQAQGVGLGIARVSKEIQRDDLFNLGEWSKARAIVFQVAQNLSSSPKVQAFLLEVIQTASSYEFSADIIFFSKNKDKNNILTEWAHVNVDELNAVFIRMLKREFHTGNVLSVMDLPESNALAVLFAWLNSGEEGAGEVNAYLRAEIERKPARLGKLAKWFFPHEFIVGTNREALFKLLSEGTIKELLDRFGEKTWSSDDERRAVERLRPLVQ